MSLNVVQKEVFKFLSRPKVLSILPFEKFSEIRFVLFSIIFIFECENLKILNQIHRESVFKNCFLKYKLKLTMNLRDLMRILQKFNNSTF
jgi:hypothetical protein